MFCFVETNIMMFFAGNQSRWGHILRWGVIMQGYYIHYKGRIPIGVSKKIDMMLKEFGKYSDIKEIDLMPSKCSLFRSLLGFLPFINIKRDYKRARECMAQCPPDYVYIRRTTADRGFLKFIKYIRDTYTDCKIIVEIMSFPYDKEQFFNFVYWPYYFKESINRKKYKLYLDRFVTFSDDETIFGVKTIRTLNGIDVGKITAVSGKRKSSDINLIGVAGMCPFHGYERLIYGLHDYNQKKGDRRIVIHLVGDGPEVSKYKNITEKYHLEEQVIFYGKKYGNELDEIYDGMDIAISSLGLYKLGVDRISSLKLNEYLAKGLPVVAGCDTVALTGKDSKYYLQFKNDGSAIDMFKIVDFYDAIYSGNKQGKEIVEDIRQLAYETVDIAVTMKGIKEYIVGR